MDTFTTELFKDAAKTIVLFGAGAATLLLTPITENIKLRLNRADLRTKQFEAFAKDISSFIFAAELMHEFLEHGWDHKQLIPDYNAAITTVRKKEFVYSAWAQRYWKQQQIPAFTKLFAQVKGVDAALHAFNDGEITEERIVKLGRRVNDLKEIATLVLSYN